MRESGICWDLISELRPPDTSYAPYPTVSWGNELRQQYSSKSSIAKRTELVLGFQLEWFPVPNRGFKSTRATTDAHLHFISQDDRGHNSKLRVAIIEAG
jgi:hypothetical protein